jgi:RHS repeat-associated protein
VNGTSVGRNGGVTTYETRYRQRFTFDVNGNMTNKTSEERTNRGARKGDVLNYTLDYEYYAGYAHRAEKIGNMYYRYDGNGNVVEERYGGHGTVTSNNAQVYEEAGGVYGTDYAFALANPGAAGTEGTAYRRDYRWNERNQLVMSVDNRYRVRYRYGAGGERAVKYTEQTRRESLYFNKYYQMNYLAGSGAGDVWEESKHVFMGETRIATKKRTERNRDNYEEEKEKQYYYHGDHLGSAQLVTNREGKVYEHLEYTPYGELWIEEADTLTGNRTPFRFTGKERDEETGLYYYGARYLDPQTSRWLSVDPAMGEYVPAPGQDAGKLPGMGGIYNTINMHVYHYAGNNPVKYIDPDGRESGAVSTLTMARQVEQREQQKQQIQRIDDIRNGEIGTFTQKQWTEALGFAPDFAESACAATALVNNVARAYTIETGKEMSLEKGAEIMLSTINDAKHIESSGYVSDMSRALNHMAREAKINGRM